eukprot:351978-Chlamydomonas_euryale.AAC.3
MGILCGIWHGMATDKREACRTGASSTHRRMPHVLCARAPPSLCMPVGSVRQLQRAERVCCVAAPLVDVGCACKKAQRSYRLRQLHILFRQTRVGVEVAPPMCVFQAGLLADLSADRRCRALGRAGEWVPVQARRPGRRKCDAPGLFFIHHVWLKRRASAA